LGNRQTPNNTLDTKHKQKINNFQQEYEQTKYYQHQLETVNKEIDVFVQQGVSNLTDKDFDTYINLQDSKNILVKRIHEIENKNQEKSKKGFDIFLE
jgi:hypothetical protein